MVIRRFLHTAALSVAMAIPIVAHAHITLAEPSAPAGSYYAGFFRVSHGCAGSPTVSLRIEIPAGVTVARPQPKPGWTLSVEKGPLAAPVRNESGQEVRQRVSAITWSGQLDADQFDQFGVMLKLPDAPGKLYFPTVQHCASGENDWTMIPSAGQAWHSVKSPAPVLEVTTPAGGSTDHMRM